MKPLLHWQRILLIGGIAVAMIASGYVAATAIRSTLDDQQDKAIQANVDELYQGCLRGNYLRKVVFSNTQAAVRRARAIGDAAATQRFSRNLTLLKATPYANDKTGAVNCDAAVPDHSP